jgi:hypothetical protein
MIYTQFDPSQLTSDQKKQWDELQKNVIEETHKLINKWENGLRVSADDFKSTVWGSLRIWLLENVFHNKCAYCETNIPEARQPGHAEHYRPKGGVTWKKLGATDLTAAQTTDHTGAALNHPGYFWLAYHWKNLVPSCVNCNSGRGKNNQFPVKNAHVLVSQLNATQKDRLSAKPIASQIWQGIYYLAPEDLDALEEPLLLHPYVDDPQKHIRFDPDGRVVAIEVTPGQVSLKGQYSIQVYELADSALDAARRRAQERGEDLYDLGLKYFKRFRRLPHDQAQKKVWEEDALV